MAVTLDWQCPHCNTNYSMQWLAEHKAQVVFCSACMSRIVLELSITIHEAKTNNEVVAAALFPDPNLPFDNP